MLTLPYNKRICITKRRFGSGCNTSRDQRLCTHKSYNVPSTVMSNIGRRCAAPSVAEPSWRMSPSIRMRRAHPKSNVRVDIVFGSPSPRPCPPAIAVRSVRGKGTGSLRRGKKCQYLRRDIPIRPSKAESHAPCVLASGCTIQPPHVEDVLQSSWLPWNTSPKRPCSASIGVHSRSVQMDRGCVPGSKWTSAPWVSGKPA
jgi:hypothetical protein